jgi:protein phosphatase
MSVESSKDTVEMFSPAGVSEDRERRIPTTHVEVSMGGLSDRGKVRPNNEDHFLAVRFGRSLEELLSNLPQGFMPARHEEIGYGLIVADGIGGHAGGEIASRSAIQALIELVVSTPDWILKRGDALIEEVMRRMEERFRQINEMLVEQTEGDPRLTGMGTTLTLACSLGLDLILTHIGDSRAYLFRGGRLHQLTRDMTMAQALVDAGTLTAAAAATHRLRHALTQCLGRAGPIEAELHHLHLEHADRLLLCTDGLTEMVADSAIGDVLQHVEDPLEACQDLVDLALQGGGKDNITVALADYRVRRVGL